MKQWITKRVTELLGIEDEILVLFIVEECQNSEASRTVYLTCLTPQEATALTQKPLLQEFDPKKLQIRFTSFLEKNTTLFMKVSLSAGDM